MNKKRRTLGIIAAVLMAAIGAITLVAYVNSAKNKAQAQESLVSVYVVNKAVPKGANAGTIKSSVSLDRIPRRLEQPGAVDNLATVDNKVAAVELQPGDQLISARLADSTTAGPAGKVQISANLTADRAVGGALHAGDLVGVYMTFSPSCGGGTAQCGAPDPARSTTQLVFQHVLVTDVQTTNTPVSQKSGNQVQQVTGTNYIVTLALTPVQSERFVYASEFGHIWLSNDPATVSPAGTQLITLGNVYTVTP
jgi:pilus assembly protein CpaB